MNDFMFTLWDVEHGLSIWIQTPSGQNHCIDAGKNNDTDFSPYVHMRILHNVKMLDYLIISHPDKDHIEGLPDLVKNLDIHEFYPEIEHCLIRINMETVNQNISKYLNILTPPIQPLLMNQTRH